MGSDEKDRLGNKLRDAERAREEQFFAERDRKLIERLKEDQGGEGDATKKAARGRCPTCGVNLQPQTLHEISVQECPDCHGVWLDQGELAELGRREEDGWIARWLRSEFQKE